MRTGLDVLIEGNEARSRFTGKIGNQSSLCVKDRRVCPLGTNRRVKSWHIVVGVPPSPPMNKALAHRPRRSSQSPVGATKKRPSHGDAGDGAPNGPVGLLICEVTAAADCPTKDPAGLGRVVMATEQKEITTSPWLRHRLPKPFYFSESRQPGPHDSCVGTIVLRLCWRDDRSKQTSFAGSRS